MGKRKQDRLTLLTKWNVMRLMAEIRGDKETERKATRYVVYYLRQFLRESHLSKVVKINKRREAQKR